MSRFTIHSFTTCQRSVLDNHGAGAKVAQPLRDERRAAQRRRALAGQRRRLSNGISTPPRVNSSGCRAVVLLDLFVADLDRPSEALIEVGLDAQTSRARDRGCAGRRARWTASSASRPGAGARLQRRRLRARSPQRRAPAARTARPRRGSADARSAAASPPPGDLRRRRSPRDPSPSAASTSVSVIGTPLTRATTRSRSS